MNLQKPIRDVSGEAVDGPTIDTLLVQTIESLPDQQVEQGDRSKLFSVLGDIARADDGQVELSEGDIKALKKYWEKASKHHDIHFAHAECVRELLEQG